MRRIFLACPYGHDDPAVVATRFEMSNRVAAAIARSKNVVFSQVSMSHPINLSMTDLQRDSIGALWAPIDEAFMEAMEELIVIDMPGWDASDGIKREIAFFQSRDRKVSLWSKVAPEFTAWQP